MPRKGGVDQKRRRDAEEGLWTMAPWREEEEIAEVEVEGPEEPLEWHIAFKSTKGKWRAESTNLKVGSRESVIREAKERLRRRITAGKWEDPDFDVREICICTMGENEWVARTMNFKADVYMSSDPEDNASSEDG
jgi:hypothetical protein